VNWRLKSLVQRACAALPVGSEQAYYGLQSMLGSLRRLPPPWERDMLRGAASLASWLREAGIPVEGRRVMEVGTGRWIDLPLGFFLCGARSVDTFDLHPYLKASLVEQSARLIGDAAAKVEELFLPVANPEALGPRLRVVREARGAADLMEKAAIRYHAPADAAATGLPDGSIDVHTSYTVFEHIPAATLTDILLEARRLLAPGGVVLHHIDPSDHFSHDDPRIPAIHFLRFSDAEWERYGGNQFGYHNRLRVNDYRRIFESCGFEILRFRESVDRRSMELLASGFSVDDRFRGLPPEALCCSVFRVLARPR
jgi:SAM-dependent methyltransferase